MRSPRDKNCIHATVGGIAEEATWRVAKLIVAYAPFRYLAHERFQFPCAEHRISSAKPTVGMVKSTIAKMPVNHVMVCKRFFIGASLRTFG